MGHKLKLFLLLVFLTGEFVHAQQTIPKDSLEAYLSMNPARDSVRVNKLIDLQAYYLVDEHQQGKAYIEEALEIAREIEYQTGIGFSLNALGAYYIRQGEVDSALTYTLSAIELFDEINEDQNIYAAYNNLALIYKRMEKYEEAVDVYKTMLKRLEGRPKTPSFVVVYFNLAKTYQSNNDWKNYSLWINNMDQLADSLGFVPGIIEARLAKAEISIHNGAYERALQLYGEVAPILDGNTELAHAKARGYKVAGTAYAKLNQSQRALRALQLGLEIYQSINTPNDEASIHQLMAEIYEGTGDYRRAFDHFQQYYAINDSLMSAERVAVVEELQMKYETEKVERAKDAAELANLQLQSDNRRTRNMFWGLFGVLGAVISVGALSYRQQKLKKKAELSEMKLKETQKRLVVEQQKREAELKAIRSQLDPHFVFNLMSSVQELTYSGDNNKVQNAVEITSQLMRKTLDHSRKAVIPLTEELEISKLYLKAEKLRFGEKLEYEFIVDEAIETDMIQVLPKIVQPYVENAVKHGLKNLTDHVSARKVSITVSPVGEELIRIEIQDNGIGREKAAQIALSNPELHNSFSTNANKERLQKIASKTDERVGIEIVDLKDDEGRAIGTRVIIILPLEI